MDLRLVLGVDGGGTKTEALVADERGRVLGRGLAGPGNWRFQGRRRAIAAVGRACRAALREAGAARADALFAGLAGVDPERPGDVPWMGAALEELGLAGRIAVDHDARVALAGATGGRPGIIVIAGTGSIAFGLGPDGRRHRAGGWGPLFGDEGSGYDVGRRALAATARHLDGRTSAGGLAARVLAALGVARPEDLVARVYGGGPGEMPVEGGVSRQEVAALAAVVVGAAAGDADARGILAGAAEELALLAETVVKGLGGAALGGGGLPIAFAGGLARGPGDPLWELFGEALARRLPGATPVRPRHTAAAGAVLLALAELGVDPAEVRLEGGGVTA